MEYGVFQLNFYNMEWKIVNFMQIYQRMNHDLNIYKSISAELPACRGKKKIKNTNIRKGGRNNQRSVPKKARF
jgi:hypothetical protein